MNINIRVDKNFKERRVTMNKSYGAKIKVGDKIFTRKVKPVWVGNFVMYIVRYKNELYLIGDGDEYIRGNLNKIYELGRKLT